LLIYCQPVSEARLYQEIVSIQRTKEIIFIKQQLHLNEIESDLFQRQKTHSKEVSRGSRHWAEDNAAYASTQHRKINLEEQLLIGLAAL
jgi:hypothetical protein